MVSVSPFSSCLSPRSPSPSKHRPPRRRSTRVLRQPPLPPRHTSHFHHCRRNPRHPRFRGLSCRGVPQDCRRPGGGAQSKGGGRRHLPSPQRADSASGNPWRPSWSGTSFLPLPLPKLNCHRSILASLGQSDTSATRTGTDPGTTAWSLPSLLVCSPSLLVKGKFHLCQLNRGSTLCRYVAEKYREQRR